MKQILACNLIDTNVPYYNKEHQNEMKHSDRSCNLNKENNEVSTSGEFETIPQEGGDKYVP